MSTTVAPAPAPIRLRPPQDDGIPATFKRRKRGIIYVRVSVARADMISPELQVGNCQTLADHNDIDIIVEPIMDLGESGRAFEDRKIHQIKEMARNKEFDVLILWIWSRFGRNLRESLQHLDDLLAYGVEVRAAKEDFDGKTTIGRFAIAQMLNIAELESNQKSDMWKDVIKRRMEIGLPHGAANRGKFGYYRCDYCPAPVPGQPMDKCHRCKDGVLKRDKKMNPVLARLYLDMVAGVPARTMVLWLRLNGYVNWTGRPIDAGDLYSILDSGYGLGFVRYTLPEELFEVITKDDGTTKTKRKSAHRDITAYLYIKGKHEACFDDPVECERIWDAYVARRLKGKTEDDKAHNWKAKYAYSGSVTCNGCGERMHSMLRAKKVQRPWKDGRPDPHDVLFRCTRHMKFKDCPSGGVYVTLKSLQDSFRPWLEKQAEAHSDEAETLPARIAELQAQAGDVRPSEAVLRLGVIKARLLELQGLEDKLTDAVMDELISKESARRRRATYETERAGLVAEKKEIEREIKSKPVIIPKPTAGAFAGVLKLFDVAEPLDQREMIRSLVREIRINRGRNPETKCEIWPLWVPPPTKPEAKDHDLTA
ncbi:recombinase family protein [Streptomyces sp. NPDC096198]|uniref:recombinase family protein n=1 Tax=Streptomyces sp. NPDC096198 TaxID=3366080 RepID=UPI003805460F